MRRLRASTAVFLLSALLDWLIVLDTRLFVAQSAFALPVTAVYTTAWIIIIQRLKGNAVAIVTGAVLGTWLGMLWP